MSADDVRRIVSKPGDDPVQAARKARSAGSLADLEEVASDRAVAARARAIAVLAIAEHCAVSDTDLPESVLDAVEDPSVVSAAMAAQIPQALTGALAAAPTDPVTQATRKLIAARMIGAGIAGAQVAMLLLATGELDAAGELLAREFLDNINDFEKLNSPESAAWATLVGGLADDRPSVFEELCSRVGAVSPIALSVLSELIEATPGLAASAKSAARGRIEHARLLATV